ncbi:MAG: adenosine deaminase [Elusimicrobia bacterium]|nr:adenosine deaminase [Elusimicrobiota bacterium]
MDENDIASAPKAELHRHIEGCVRLDTLRDIHRRAGLRLPSEDPAELDRIYRLRAPGASLAEVLGMFTLAQACFVSYEDVERITREALEDAYRKENVRLLELRYSPDFMLGGRGLDWQKAHDIIVSVCENFEKSSRMVCGVILIASRGYGLESAEKTADFAAKNRRSVIGFDLADDEAGHPSRLFRGVAARLRSFGIPLTVHSGEEGHYSQIEETLRELAPERIGHGVKAAEDPAGRVIELLKSGGVTVETNPWSNYLTRAVPSVEAHPLKKFIEAGVKCSIGADDPEILATDLNNEYQLSLGRMGLSAADIGYTLRCAVEGSFLSPDRRAQAARELGL